MNIKIKLLKLSLFLGIISSILVGCKKEEIVTPPKETTPPAEVKMNATFSTPNMEFTVFGDTIEDHQFKAVFTNIETTNNEASDSLFVWEQLSATMPASWYVYVCADGVCHNKAITNANFDINPGAKTSFYVDFASINDKGNVQPLGKGTGEAVYLIYRKGMKKEDGIKVTVKLIAK